MKRTPIRRAGKRTVAWQKDREALIPEFISRGITSCEAILDGDCAGRLYTHFAHRHQRWWYIRRPHLLGKINQVILACDPCHGKMDHNKELLEKTFRRLRGAELLE